MHTCKQIKGAFYSEGPKHKECQKVRNVTKCKRLKLTFLSKKKYHTSSLPIGQFISQVSLHPILHGMKMGTTATCEDNNGWSSLHLNDTFFTMVVNARCPVHQAQSAPRCCHSTLGQTSAYMCFYRLLFSPLFLG